MTAGVATRDRGYMPQLDALRFFAVMGVLLVHLWRPSGNTPIVGQVDWADLGVRLFFVLSGFLITGILLGGRGFPGGTARLRYVRQFYVRRFLRIFPVYYLVIAVLILAGVGGILHFSPWLFTYSTNIAIWHDLAFPYAVPHFWTLAVEEQFYIVWPWLLLFLPPRWIIPLLVGLCALGPAWRLWTTFHYGRQDWDPALTFTPAVVDFLAMGALLAILLRPGAALERRRSALRTAGLVGLAMYAALYWWSRHGDHHIHVALGDTGAALVFCWLIASASRGFGGPAGRVLEWRPIVYLGKISYGIYIYHLLVPLAFLRIAPHIGVTYRDRGFAFFLVASLVTFGVAAISWHGFERPLNNLKRRFRYLDTAQPSGGTVGGVAAET